MKSKVLFAGPVLFMVAQLILPAAATGFEERLLIVQANTDRWISGHLLIMASFPLLGVFFYRWYEMARLNYSRISAIGIWMMLWALMADFCIAAFQLLLPANADASHAITNNKLIQMAVFLPYMLFLPGAIMLSIPLVRVMEHKTPSIALVMASILLVAGGILQVKIIFILAAAAILLQAILFLRQNN
jgi:hypothetical protein